MKLKATTDTIFTINKSLNKNKFTDKVELYQASYLKLPFIKYNIGKLENYPIDSMDEVEVKYHPVVSQFKFYYHIKIIGAGLQFEHLCYAKANFWQHLKLTVCNRFWTLFESSEKSLATLTFILAVSTVALAILTYLHHLDFKIIIDLLKSK